MSGPPDTLVQLGDFVFGGPEGFEIPEVIPWGGEQAQVIHRLVGGVKVLDAMGAFEEPLTWSGRFRGPDALSRAQQLDQMRQAGAQQTLTWGGLSYLVNITHFHAEYQRFYEIPYTITCEAVANNTAANTAGGDPSLDDQMNDDMASVTDASNAVGNSSLTSAVASVQSAVSAVSTFVGASQAVIQSVLNPLATLQVVTQGLITSTQALIPDVGGLGGVVAGQRGEISAAALLSQVTASAQLPNLYSVSSLVNRMTANLNADGSSGALLTTAQDLYHVAARAYGDPSAWTDIAEANGLSDPVLVGVQTIRVPATDSGSGGVLSVL